MLRSREERSSPALIDDARTWSWGELMDEVEVVARGLEEDLGGGPVFIDCPSGSSFLVTFLAASRAGRPACTLHHDWAGPELQAAMADAGEFRADAGERDDPVFYIGFTSGTSGRPKPFARRLRSWTSSFPPAGDLFGIEPGDTVHLPGSMQHSHFLFGAVLGLDRGAAIRLYERFDAARLAGELERSPRGIVYLVPTMLFDLADLGAGPFEGVHSVVVSGAKMEPHHWEMAGRLFPEAKVGEIYGASELSFVTVNSAGESQEDPGYVGPPFPGVEIEIRPTGATGPDEPGLVFVRSPYLFDGYIDGPDSVAPSDADGFMTVGDVGVLGPEGLSIVGRASNMLITGGKNVHPEEVETRIAEHPAVAECVVAGVPHSRWGEELVAFVVPTGSEDELDVESLRTHLGPRVAAYKIPKRWFRVAAIPRTPAGKTDRSRDRLFERATEI